jgi:ParB-like chromosome segregation protein Spo0J
MEVLLLPLQRRDLCASALCCVGGDATDEEEGKSLLDWNGIKIVETDCMLPIDRVKPYARNAKRHPQEQIDEIKASIKRFGMDDPIGIWGKENLIVEGHGRLEACKQLGIPTVPCIRLDHLTKEERKAYTLAHNKTNMDSGWDFTALDQELAEIVDVDMSEFGFGASVGGARSQH